MKNYRGHTLNRNQAEALKEVILAMGSLQEKAQEKEKCSTESVDNLICKVESFLNELEATDPLVIGEIIDDKEYHQ
ncbi:hypothetical protein [Bacillus safensis]|uniref:hypothetical protein n=1 Tax=Bacillus safensis TaxID=561879 RepID=UPI00090B3A2D|nr:hypothetical protein [Bacillus safensis]APJ11054.1 hypothetical protein BSL056_08815 [Bacillus safensis]